MNQYFVKGELLRMVINIKEDLSNVNQKLDSVVDMAGESYQIPVGGTSNMQAHTTNSILIQKYQVMNSSGVFRYLVAL